MGQPLSVPPGFDDMPVEEKIDYVQTLWDRIFRHDHAQIPSPRWHRDEVQAALADHERDPAAARPWSEVRRELEAKLKPRG
jgi:putative addiction module component (TIGR02574 family)